MSEDFVVVGIIVTLLIDLGIDWAAKTSNHNEGLSWCEHFYKPYSNSINLF